MCRQVSPLWKLEFLRLISKSKVLVDVATLICKDGLLLVYIGYTDRWKSLNDVHEGYLTEERCTCDMNRRQTRL